MKYLKPVLICFSLFLLIKSKAQTINIFPSSKYYITFEGKYNNKRVRIYSDDSLIFNQRITSKNPDVLIMAKVVTINSFPKNVKVKIGNKKLLFSTNPSKPYLYIRKKNMQYTLVDSENQRKYR